MKDIPALATNTVTTVVIHELIFKIFKAYPSFQINILLTSRSCVTVPCKVSNDDQYKKASAAHSAWRWSDVLLASIFTRGKTLTF